MMAALDVSLGEIAGYVLVAVLGVICVAGIVACVREIRNGEWW